MKERYSVAVIYSDRQWVRYLSDFQFEGHHAVSSKVINFLRRAWFLAGMPLGVWRLIARRWDSVVRTYSRVGADLNFFPAQDTMAYQVPGKSMSTIHDLMHIYENRFPEVSLGGRGPRRDRHYQRTLDNCTKVLVDSRLGKQQVLDNYRANPEAIAVLPYVAPNYIIQAAKTNSATSEFCASLPEKFFFYPAQFWPHKNHRILVQAAVILKDLPIAFVFVGSKKNGYDDLIRYASESNVAQQFIFLGYVPNETLPDLYKRARALVMPTFFGPTNIPPLEAFALGCPVAISRRYGMPEQVGDAALLFDPESAEEVADTLRRLWTDDKLCIELSERGKNRAAVWGIEQFSDALGQILEASLS
jgi:glycosyltransferase involved in cell wall biosynthesis